jgi:nucleoside-diphosphate-sugar epimerase
VALSNSLIMITDALKTDFIDASARVLVTGGSGFIGSHLVRNLDEDGIPTINLDVSPPLLTEFECKWKRVDMLDVESVHEAFQQFRPTHVVHLAARTDLDEDATIEGYAVNTRGIDNLLSAIIKVKTVRRIIITSSMLVCRLGYRPRTETDYAPSTVYGESKVMTEQITRRTDPPCIWTIIRPASIWGPLDNRLRDGFFWMLRKGIYVHPGSKVCLKSYGYVGNSVFQIRKILEAPADAVRGKTFYIADQPIDLRAWVNQFSRMLVRRNAIVVPRALMNAGACAGDLITYLGFDNFPLTSFRLKNMTTENIVDTSELDRLTGPVPFTVENGVEATVRWYHSER